MGKTKKQAGNAPEGETKDPKAKSKMRKPSLTRYLNENRSLVNKKKRVDRHLRRYPNDEQAKAIRAAL